MLCHVNLQVRMIATRKKYLLTSFDALPGAVKQFMLRLVDILQLVQRKKMRA